MRRISFTKMFSAIIMLASVNSFIGCSDKDNNYDDDFETGIVVESESLNNCPDNNHPHMIDLGLPSGKLWSCCNVGANSPEQCGNYYSWGSINTQNSYSWASYRFYDNKQFSKYNKEDGKVELDNNDDIANITNNNWEMPNNKNVKELTEYTTPKWIKGNGVKGMKFTSKINGKSIFMPASGVYADKIYNIKEEAGYYWTSSLSDYTHDLANNLIFVYKSINVQANPRYFGMNIRPVSK